MIKRDNKDKILKEFKELYVKNRWITKFDEIIKKYNGNKDFIEENIISKFDLLCNEAILLQEKELKGEIKYIYFSLLRTSILENKGEYRIDLYDENWFLDKEECSINIELDFIYEQLFNHIEELLDEKEKYGRTIKEMDIEKIKLNETNIYHTLSIQFLSIIIKKLIEIPSYKEMKKKEDIIVSVGEYMDVTKRIYL